MNDRSWRKAAVHTKTGSRVDNEWVENYPVSDRQGDRKTLSGLLRRGQGARQEAFAEYWME
jgi:hypothetical protein